MDENIRKKELISELDILIEQEKDTLQKLALIQQRLDALCSLIPQGDRAKANVG